MIKLGTQVRDIETGFEGTVTARAEYLHGTPRVMVESLDETNRPIEWWYEESRMQEIIK